MAEPTCEMCEDTGYEPGAPPLSYCTLCARGLAVAVQRTELLDEHGLTEEDVEDYMAQFAAGLSERPEQEG